MAILYQLLGISTILQNVQYHPSVCVRHVFLWLIGVILANAQIAISIMCVCPGAIQVDLSTLASVHNCIDVEHL